MATFITNATQDGRQDGVAITTQFATVTITGLDANPGSNARVQLQYSEDDSTYYDTTDVFFRDGAYDIAILAGTNSNFIAANVIGLSEKSAPTEIDGTILFNPA